MPLTFFALLFCASWLIPHHFPPWISWHNEICAFAAVLWLYGWILIHQKFDIRRPVKAPLALWPPVLLTIVGVIQLVTGHIAFAGDAWVLGFYLMLCIFAIHIGYAIVGEHEPSSIISRLSVLLVVVGAVSVTISLIQTLEISSNPNWIWRMPTLRRPGANLGQPNQLATLILFALVSLYFLFEARRVRTLITLPLAAILILGLAITESRSGALGLLVMVGWWILKRRSITFSISLSVVGSGVLFFALCFWFWPACFSLIQEGGWSSHAVTAKVNTSAGTRLVIWPQLWEAAMQRPWFGWGLREVSTAQNAVLHGYSESEPFTYAHNIVLDLAIGVGIPVTLLLLGVTCVWLWRRARAANDLVTWYCIAIALPFGVHSMLEFPFAYAYLLAPVMFLLGVLEARLAPRRMVAIPWWTAAAAWALVSAAMAWSVVEYIVIEEDFRMARFEAFNVGKTPSSYERPHIVLLTQLGDLLEGARLIPAPGMAPQRIELARKVAMHFPATATQNRYAQSLALNGNPQEAIRQLRVMRAMHGEANYAQIKAGWITLASEKYPQLRAVELP